MSGNSKLYDEDFKKMTVERYHSGSSVSDLELEYGVTRVTIYKWIKDYSEIEIDENITVTKKEMLEVKKENKKFKDLIMNIYLKSKKRYGAPKIKIKFNKLGHNISINRVQRLMREINIRSIVKKKYKHYSSNKSDFKRGENLLIRNFNASDINKKWVTDITYIHTLKDGWCYLASAMDSFTKKIIGYFFQKYGYKNNYRSFK
jgi:transposase-like protein